MRRKLCKFITPLGEYIWASKVQTRTGSDQNQTTQSSQLRGRTEPDHLCARPNWIEPNSNIHITRVEKHELYENQ